MIHNIIPDLSDKAVPISELKFLPGNPQKGDVPGIMAVFEEFGQHTTILARRDGTVIAGNHRLEAAVRLGWTHIACVFVDDDEERSLARAITDNRIQQLSKTDDAKLSEILPVVMDDYYQVLDVLGWDEFELAAMQESVVTPTLEERGYVAPVLRDRDQVVPEREVVEGQRDRLSAPGEMDPRELITRGAGDTDDKRRAVIQYTLVFDNPEQQRKWYDFIRYLRDDPAVDGETTAEKLIDFIESHTP